MDGVINIYKEKGFTSHDVVAVVRKIIGQKKVGHTGTLDPEAEGVLPICLGKATKLADYIMAEKKEYTAIVKLGIITTTEDAFGEVLEEKEVIFDENRIKEAVYSFKGSCMQTPPMYSAIKVNGKKLYELAREGKEIERKSRKIFIFDIQILGFLPPDSVKIHVVCSKGTYIRTLCSDIGKKLECGAHMAALVRTASGNFKLENAITLSNLKNLKESNELEKVLISIDKVLENYNKVYVKEKSTKLLYNGGKIYEDFFLNCTKPVVIGEKILAYDSKKNFVGIFEINRDEEKNKVYIKPLKIML